MPQLIGEILSLSEAFSLESKRLSKVILSQSEIYNISILSLALALLEINRPTLVIEENEERALKLFTSIKALSEFYGIENNALYLPSEGTDRYVTLAKLKGEFKKILVTTTEALKIDPEVLSRSISLSKGEHFEREFLREKLLQAGYSQVEIVLQEGEFAHHGWVFDLWNLGDDYPTRVEFFGDEIEEIKLFEPETQKSFRNIDHLLLIPFSEGERYESILNLIAPEVLVTAVREANFEKELIRVIKISHLPYRFSNQSFDAKDLSIAGLGVLPKERKTLQDFPRNLKGLKIPILFVLSSQGKAETVKEILFNHDIIAPVINRADVGRYSGKYAITVSDLGEALFRENLLILTESQLFTEKSYKKRKVSLQKIPLESLEIREGEFIVHKDHGIGVFRGIKRQTYEDYHEDVLVIEYKDGDILYVPTWNIEKVYKYSAKEGFLPSIDKLGTSRWQKIKEKERKRLHEIADKLIRIYASRKEERGFTYSEDREIHRNFDDFFPYDETEDQLRAIEAILKKMREPYPLDVLLCGDAGYGKTEVAMRAAFRAVYDGKQVAVLVPTTLLCEQHYRTFKRRFEAFPVSIEYLSRFRSSKEIQEVIEKTKEGKVDILIGTHILVLKEIDFSDLGLLIIDEEQKFGVEHKEKLKEKYPKVDLITISATPIPRTLQMGLSGLWDIYIIQTPPKERLAVKTIVINDNDSLIKEAIERELKRDGQVYFLHNRINDIEICKNKIKSLVPEARVAIAHGRMKERDLDKIMLSFLEGEIDVLVCTSIIASGIDIPNVNTIIINRADLFGLSDLYQIRGRVGRSQRQAYAYLVLPPEDSLTDTAKKRIKSIQEMSYLGAGFQVALRDLEIRGAGELLGVEQSGINKLGFDLYIEMLNEAIKELKGETVIPSKLPEIKLTIPAFIPEDYIDNVSMRISIYRKLSTVTDEREIDRLYQETLDRFGRLPREAENLFKVSKLRLIASQLKIEKIRQVRAGFRFTLLREIDSNFAGNLIDTLSKFKKKEIVKELKFYPDGFEIGEQDIDKITLTLKRIIEKVSELNLVNQN